MYGHGCSLIDVCLLQLVDDLLDFTSSEALMGKPTAADLKLGLATAPVLFAALEVSAGVCRFTLSVVIL